MSIALKAVPVTSFEDITLNFEQLGAEVLTAADARVTGADWITPTLLNSWTAYTPVGYLRDPLGFVHMKGILIGGTSGTVAFVLPAGYRPGQVLQMPAGTGSGAAMIAIATSGNVTLLGTPSEGIGPDGITFLAEN